MAHTDLIVLRKIQYRETSIIVAGLSAEFGRLDIIVKGAKKLSSKTFPAVDLFREISVEIEPGKRNLYSVYSADLIANHDNIASCHSNYLAACDIASFVLRNSQPEIPSPELYIAVKNAFGILSRGPTEIPYPVLVRLVYLDEHGLLPELPDHDQAKAKLLAQLVNAARGKIELPDITADYWNIFGDWIDSLCRFNELN